jgi:hypothetical protein
MFKKEQPRNMQDSAFELVVLRWILWALFFAILLGGRPWIFPENGKLWIESLPLNKTTNSQAAPK